MKQACLTAAFLMLFTSLLSAQGALKTAADIPQEEPTKWERVKQHIEFSGYLQAQWNYRTSRDKVSRLDSVGNSTTEKVRVDTVAVNTMSGGYFDRFVSNQFRLRRGRFQVGINYDFIHSKMSFDVTERGFHITDMYVRLTDPWKKVASIQGGVFKVPFGYEVKESSADRPFAERSRVIQHLFPTVRDVGAMVSLHAPEGHKAHGLRLDFAAINGARSSMEADKYKDFVGRLRYDRSFADGKVEIGAGFSYYWGGHAHFSDINVGANQFIVFEGIGRTEGDTAFFMVNQELTDKAGRNGARVKKQHFGGDLMVKAKWAGGTTRIAGEFVGGQQTGVMQRRLDPLRQYTATSYTPKGTTLGVSWVAESPPVPANPATVSTINVPSHDFIRDFIGGSVSLVHEIMETGLEVAFRYDFYDPNTGVEGEEIRILQSTSQTLALSVADVKYQTYSVGLNYTINEFVKILATYDIVRNEETSVEGRGVVATTDDAIAPSYSYMVDVPDDVLTIRLQVSW